MSQEKKARVAQQSPLHFKGNQHVSERGSRLAESSGGVAVKPASDASISSVRIGPAKGEYESSEGHARADLLFHTDKLRAGDAFKAAALSEEGQVLGHITHQNIDGGTNHVWASIGGFAPETATIRFYDGKTLLHARRVSESELGSDSLTIATSALPPDSWHYETYVDGEGRKRVRVVADYAGESSLAPLPTSTSPETAFREANIGTGPSVERADLRPTGSSAVPSQDQKGAASLAPQSARLRVTHVAIAMKGVRAEAKVRSVRFTRRGGGFTITDERFK